MPDEETKWTQFGGPHMFAEEMRQAMSSGAQLGSTIKLIQNIPTFAVKCLKCGKYHLFSDLLKGCGNCSSTSYAIGGTPTQIAIICGSCGTELLASVKCDCGCVNPLDVDTMNQPKTGGTCFIATAASGDPFAPEVAALSAFRDDVLLQDRLGTAFVRLYYSVSPPIAAAVARSNLLRRVAMGLVVKPAVWFVRAILHSR
jgi:hypothetical protein